MLLATEQTILVSVVFSRLEFVPPLVPHKLGLFILNLANNQEVFMATFPCCGNRVSSVIVSNEC